MRIVAIVQARTGSSRLPNKVLMDVNGKTMLERVVERLKRAKLLDLIVVATTTSKSDDKIKNLAQKIKIPFYRGSESDVLSRYYQAAKKFKADLIVRITADCPFISPYVVDKVIKCHKKSNADYTHAIAQSHNSRSYPSGVNAEIFSFKTLVEIHKEARKKYQREHVTVYLEEHPERYKIECVEPEEKFRRASYRLTVDTKDDMELVRKVYSSFSEKKFISLADVIRFLDKNPELSKINLSVKQKTGSAKLEKQKINSKILFRVDVNYKLGIGHVMRCLSLATEFKKLGYNPLFLSKRDPLVGKIIGKQHPIIYLPTCQSDNEAAYSVCNKMSQIIPVVTVVDLQDVNDDTFIALKRFSGLLIDINSESNSDLYSDIIVKGDVVVTANKQPYADYYLGPKYKILGHQFFNVRDKKRKARSRIGRILISMGGTDPNNLTLKVVRALLRVDVEITVVIGSGFRKEKELLNLVRGNKGCLIQKSPKNFCKLLAEADICYVSGGIVLYESICIGTPPIVLCQNQSQHSDALMLEKHGCCICLGPGKQVSLHKIRESLEELSDFCLRKGIQEKGMKIVDGLGAERIAKEAHAKIETTKNKRLLVVGGGCEQIPLVKSAKAMGCQVITVDKNIRASGFVFSDYSYVIDTKDIDSIRLIANKHRVDGVITSTETGVDSVAVISSERDYPNISKLPSLLRLDKLKIKEQFVKQNVPTARYAAVATFGEALKAAKKLGMPVILKPCDNAAARGVLKVGKLGEMENAYNYAVSNTKLPYILVEEFLGGKELGCEAFLFDSKIRLVVLTDKIKSKLPYNVVMGHTVPCSLPYQVEKKVKSMVKRSLDALKIEMGPVNLDIILTDKGPRVIDIGIRLGGNNLPLLVYLSTGVNTYKEAVKVALKVEPDLRARFNRASGTYYLRPMRGKVRGISGLDSLVHIDGLVCFKAGIRLGSVIREVTDVSHRAGSFVVTAPNLKKLRIAAKKVNHTFQITTSD